MINGRSAANPVPEMPSAPITTCRPDELQSDVRHRCDNTGDGHGQREPAVAEPAAHEIGGRDVVVLVADVPDAREYDEEDRIGDDGIGYRKESHGSGTKGQRRDRYKGVGSVEVATDKEPGDDGAKAPPTQPPLVQQVEIAFAPVSRREA